MKLRFNAQILFTGIILVAFFLPWFSFGILELSGYNLPGRIAALDRFGGRSDASLSYLYLVYVIPVLAVLITMLNLKNIATQIPSLLLGALTLLAFGAWVFEKGSSVFEIMTVGAYLTIISAVPLTLSAIGLIRFGEETGGAGSDPAAFFRSHGKKIGIGAAGIAAAILLFVGGRAAYRKLTAPAQKITVTSASASSTLAASANYDYRAANAFDWSASTAWGEGVKGDGIGESLVAEFGETVKIKSIGIVNGFAETHASLGNLYTLNNRVKKAKLIFDDGEEILAFEDGKETEQKIGLNSAHKTKSVKFVILEIYKGAKWDDTLISSVSFYDK